MLFRSAVLDAIRQGQVTLAFRRWRKPTVKPGGTLRTAIGVLAIRQVEPVDLDATTGQDAKRAGFANRTDLLADLAKQREGQLYKIVFEWLGADDRVALRAQATLKAEEISALRDCLSRFDRTPDGPWSLNTLRLIDRRNDVAAGELADALGMDKALFKRRVRKLKDLGLTESLRVGYRLSPRGCALLAALPNLR
ncbi:MULTISPECIES: hypothetical protein [unclassified Beijerinckia]|uniref:hypothetical protein n=1 Tax=unclassified Beijerinckia TaxID=2638183 RepID=UPI000897E053|nr:MULTISPECIES: hypothetical protein [unclassified Beijerinckia]MDH7795288.1 DNA-binding transcriptional ArsR family regulator [Beijerinckia sp. GAS462]SEB95333.1 hypothetical protein SAMN05443249_1561 [Beijerinckia sp. 28-YEA-48]